MEEHPIEGLMQAAMHSIRDMIDVNTIIGEPMEISEEITIIPISKVGFGFAAGGSEFKGETIEDYKKKEDEESIAYRNPFGGGSGAGVSIKPVAFLVIQNDMVKLMPVEHSCTIDRVLDYIPEIFDKTEKLIEKMCNKKEETNEIKIQKPKIKKVGINYKYNYQEPNEEKEEDDE